MHRSTTSLTTSLALLTSSFPYTFASPAAAPNPDVDADATTTTAPTTAWSGNYPGYSYSAGPDGYCDSAPGWSECIRSGSYSGGDSGVTVTAGSAGGGVVSTTDAQGSTVTSTETETSTASADGSSQTVVEAGSGSSSSGGGDGGSSTVTGTSASGTAETNIAPRVIGSDHQARLLMAVLAATGVAAMAGFLL